MSKLVEVLKQRLLIHGAYVRCFNTPDGRAVLSHLMRTGFVFTSTHVPGDPHQSSMNEGTRRMVLSILKYVNKDHKELVNQVEQEMQHDH